MLDQKLNGHEDYYSRRLSEKREEAARQQKQQAQQQAKQQTQQRTQQQQYELWTGAIGQFTNRYVTKRLQQQHEQVVALKITALEAKNAALQSRIEKLESQLSLNARFTELESTLAARQEALNAAKRGAKGERGARGERGERGPRGDKGDKGEPGNVPKIISSKVDENYNLTILRSGDVLEIIPLRAAFERFYAEVSSIYVSTADEV